MRVGIIGAGISGLSAALALRQAGHEVDVFQREDEAGGLLATFDFDGVPVEHFYHFLCRTDIGFFRFCQQLEISPFLRFDEVSTGFYYNGAPFRFCKPLDLLLFPGFPLADRLRLGKFAIDIRKRQDWEALDRIPAKQWLIDRLGETVYRVVWEPLLALKFGDYHDRISAAWIAHRVHRVARSRNQMGYLEGGTRRLLDTLVARLEAEGVRLHTGRPVKRILAEGDRVSGLAFDGHPDHACDRVISTVPLPVLAGLLPAGWEEYAAALSRIDYIGVVCVALKLRRPVSRHFWYNVHDPRIPFNGIIEYTNLNPMPGLGGHLVYVPYYAATDRPIYSLPDAEAVAQSWAALKRMNPALEDGDLLDSHVARTPYAQAICPAGFQDMLPDQIAPLKGLRLLDSTFLYPEDRTQSGHIVKALACAADIEAE
ncbi:MAG: NAD(P)/FAD-dependent oxidoreductase [Candidatus Hydrogenedentes bacterium]|nr:NAD(P)/FAD-dependent oxidoreductase [Candidatus Hydrogenedentota bacterium]